MNTPAEAAISTPTAIDPVSGLAFVLNSTSSYPLNFNQIQIFNLSTFASTGTYIPVTLQSSSNSITNPDYPVGIVPLGYEWTRLPNTDSRLFIAFEPRERPV